MLASARAGLVRQMSFRNAGRCRSADTRSRTLTGGLSDEVGRLAEMVFKKLSIAGAQASLGPEGGDGRFGRGK